MLFSPNGTLSRFFVHSILIPLLLGSAYVFIVFKIYQNGNFLDGFGLYLGIENLYAVFSDENFLLIFWLHFLSISLFSKSMIFALTAIDFAILFSFHLITVSIA